MKTITWKEGKVEVEVPDHRRYGVSAGMPVFFNPRARISRDISTLILSVLRPPQVLDAMCGTGIRGIRYAVEAGVENVVFNDINPLALDLAKRNAERYDIDAEFLQEDFNVLGHTRRFEGIDLDPYGHPSPFLDALARSITHKGIVLVTATDTAALTGSSPNPATRKYHVKVRKVDWFKELAVRVLVGYVQHRLNVYEKAFVPIASFLAEHQARVIGLVLKKPSAVTRAAEQMEIVQGMGPLWTGALHDREVVREALKRWDGDYSPEARSFLERAAEEVDTVGYYNLHFLAKKLGISQIPSVKRVMDELRERGYRVSRSSLEPRAVKTDAPEKVVTDVLRSLSGTS